MRRLQAIVPVLAISMFGAVCFAQTSEPFQLASRFGDHVKAYEALKSRAEVQMRQENRITEEWHGLDKLMDTSSISEERLKVAGELYDLYENTRDPEAKKAVRATMATIVGHYAALTAIEIRAVNLNGILTKELALEENDKLLMDLLTAKKLFESMMRA